MSNKKSFLYNILKLLSSKIKITNIKNKHNLVQNLVTKLHANVMNTFVNSIRML